MLSILAWPLGSIEAARAQGPELPVRLEVVSELPCATTAAVQSRIRARSDRVRFVAAGRAKLVRAEVARGGNAGVVARLSVERDDGAIATRELRAPSCDEAVDALALVAAVTLDPSIVGEAPSEPEPAERAPAEPPRAEPRPAPAPIAPSAPARASPSETLIPSAGVSAIATWGPAPELLPGAAAYVELEWQRGDLLSPAVRLHALRAWRGGFDAQNGSASFTLTAAMLELCPIALGDEGLELRPCAMLTGGVLSAEGSRTEAPRSEHRPWWVLGASAVVSARPTERLALSLTANAGRALVRDRFQFDPEVFHEVAPLAFSAGVGAGLRFP